MRGAMKFGGRGIEIYEISLKFTEISVKFHSGNLGAVTYISAHSGGGALKWVKFPPIFH